MQCVGEEQRLDVHLGLSVPHPVQRSTIESDIDGVHS